MRLAPRWWSPPMWTWAPTVGTLSVKVSSNQVSVRKYLSPCVLALLLTRVCGSSPIPDMPPARQGDTPVAHRGGGRSVRHTPDCGGAVSGMGNRVL